MKKTFKYRFLAICIHFLSGVVILVIGIYGVNTYHLSTDGESAFYQKKSYGVTKRERYIQKTNSKHPFLPLVFGGGCIFFGSFSVMYSVVVFVDRIGKNKFTLEFDSTKLVLGKPFFRAKTIIYWKDVVEYKIYENGGGFFENIFIRSATGKKVSLLPRFYEGLTIDYLRAEFKEYINKTL